jgi:hypothetical protein
MSETNSQQTGKEAGPLNPCLQTGREGSGSALEPVPQAFLQIYLLNGREFDVRTLDGKCKAWLKALHFLLCVGGVKWTGFFGNCTD